MDKLTNSVRHYAWGSREALARIQRRPSPSAQPEAELWMGAHHRAPSRVQRDGATTDLAQCIRDRPAAELGDAVLARFGPRLPFLLKVLAAVEPLSLQCHPAHEEARAGGWSDPWGKPELLCAVTGFDALCGLRSQEDILRLLLPLRVPQLAARVHREPDPGGVLRWLLDAPADVLAALGATLRDTAARAADEPGPDRAHYAALARLAADRPGDPGVPAAVLLHHVHLEPGEALYVRPGEPHSYLRGVGVEIMGSSDNTVRGGLTDKEVDAERFLGLLRGSGAPTVVRPREEGPGFETYPAPAPEFRLHRLHLDGCVRLVAAGPQLVFCLEGAARLGCAGQDLEVAGGEAVYVGADHGPVTVTGQGTLFVATAGIHATAVACEAVAAIPQQRTVAGSGVG